MISTTATRPWYPEFAHRVQPFPFVNDSFSCDTPLGQYSSGIAAISALIAATVAGGTSTGLAQYSQIRRAKRCAITTFTVDANRNGSTPISIRRGIAPTASFVCKGERTR